jgi:hypothetical protein
MSVGTIKPFNSPGLSGSEQRRGGSRIQQLQQKLKELNEELSKAAMGPGTPEEKEKRIEMLTQQILSITQEIERLQKEEQEKKVEKQRARTDGDKPENDSLKAGNKLIDLYV